MAVTREQAINDGVTGGCPLIDGREKIDFDTIIGEVITVEAFALTKTKDGEAYAMTFNEYANGYAWAGGWLKKMIEHYGEEFIGTKLVVGEKVKTNSNKDFRTFEIFDGKKKSKK